MIAALAGRRIDADEAPSPRFPFKNIEKVRKELYQFFAENKPAYLICSGACGADLIALDAAGNAGIARKMVLPFQAAKFRTTSVTDRPGNWGNMFNIIYNELSKRSNVIIADYSEDDKNVYEEANFDILNTADFLYEQIESEKGQAEKSGANKKIAIVIWEGFPKNSHDTTNHFKQEAIKRGYEILEINSLK